MMYEDLLAKFSENPHLTIYNKQSSLFMGSFIVDFYYKDKINMQFLNDRGIVEVSLVVPSVFSLNAIPLKFVVDFVQGIQSPNSKYIFSNVLEGYEFFMNNMQILDKIIENKMLKKINRKWGQPRPNRDNRTNHTVL